MEFVLNKESQIAIDAAKKFKESQDFIERLLKESLDNRYEILKEIEEIEEKVLTPLKEKIKVHCV